MAQPRSPFLPLYKDLPATLPVFPLPNVIVMPGAELPLIIFEPRYLNMVEDALKTHHLIGMVQPEPDSQESPPPLCTTGCAGRITSYTETNDGRIAITLTGAIRFHILEELSAIRGYRVVVPEWRQFATDLKPESEKLLSDRPRFTQALRHYLKEKHLEIDWSTLERIPDLPLVHMMATLLPLTGLEKQAILESRDPVQRAGLLLAALEMPIQTGPGSSRH